MTFDRGLAQIPLMPIRPKLGRASSNKNKVDMSEPIGCHCAPFFILLLIAVRIFFAPPFDVFHSPVCVSEAVQAEIIYGGSVCGGSGDFRLESQSVQGRTTRR